MVELLTFEDGFATIATDIRQTYKYPTLLVLTMKKGKRFCRKMPSSLADVDMASCNETLNPDPKGVANHPQHLEEE